MIEFSSLSVSAFLQEKVFCKAGPVSQKIAVALERLENLGQILRQHLQNALCYLGQKLSFRDLKVKSPSTSSDSKEVEDKASGLFFQLFGSGQAGPDEAASHIFNFLSAEDKLNLRLVSKGAEQAGYNHSSSIFKKASKEVFIRKLLNLDEASWMLYKEDAENNLQEFLSLPAPFFFQSGDFEEFLKKIPYVPPQSYQHWEDQFVMRGRQPPLAIFRSYLGDNPALILLWKKPRSLFWMKDDWASHFFLHAQKNTYVTDYRRCKSELGNFTMDVDSLTTEYGHSLTFKEDVWPYILNRSKILQESIEHKKAKVGQGLFRYFFK